MPQIKVQVPAEIRKFETQVDNSYKLVLGTPEIAPDEAATLLSLKGRAGWLLFACEPFKEEDVPDEPVPEFKDDVSPSKRLRSCLYRYWELCTNRSTDFRTFYDAWMDHKCDEIKERLPK